MTGVLATLEPYALDLWRHDVREWFPADRHIQGTSKQTLFGGLYQLLTITV